MIYILVGNNANKKSSYIQKLANGSDIVKLPHASISIEILKEYSENISLFGDSPIILMENALSESISLTIDDLKILSESKTIFICNEDKLLKAEEKKYIKYATIEYFEEKEAKAIPKINTFAIADAYARRDKVSTWILYRQAVEKGAEPEMISGMLFWKIKTMIQNGTKNFSVNELKHNSSCIVSLYHEAHRGESDFVVGLEQFILKTLSK